MALFQNKSIHEQRWPEVDPDALIPILVTVRGSLTLSHTTNFRLFKTESVGRRRF